MGAAFAKCKTCALWFNAGFEYPDRPTSAELLCPVGHRHTYGGDEFVDASFFERRARRVAGRPSL